MMKKLATIFVVASLMGSISSSGSFFDSFDEYTSEVNAWKSDWDRVDDALYTNPDLKRLLTNWLEQNKSNDSCVAKLAFDKVLNVWTRQKEAADLLAVVEFQLLASSDSDADFDTECAQIDNNYEPVCSINARVDISYADGNVEVKISDWICTLEKVE